jgi:CHAT domain
LRWTERWRGRTSAIPPVHPPDDVGFAAELAKLRQITRHLNQAAIEGRPVGTLEQERRRVEDEVRRHVLRTSGPAAEAPARHFGIDGILAALGDTRLVEVIQVDGRLHVLVATTAGVRRHAAGTWENAVRDAEFSRFALRRLARRMRPEPANGPGPGIRSEPPEAVLAMLDKFGLRLQEQLLAEAADDLGDGPVVIVPPAALHPVPWGLLPALTGRAVTVAPSATAWLRGQRIQPPADHTVTVVAGPGLKGAQAEATALADRYVNAEVLSAGMATADKVLTSLEGRWLAHIAAHGTFRADNPLFSSLLMEDGSLTVHDLQRLGHAPYRLVLSCCSSGVTAPAGADELLGLVAALEQLGTAGVLAPVVTVNDLATVRLSLALHERLASGATSSQALRDARLSSSDDLGLYVAARAYVAFGAA